MSIKNIFGGGRSAVSDEQSPVRPSKETSSAPQARKTTTTGSTVFAGLAPRVRLDLPQSGLGLERYGITGEHAGGAVDKNLPSVPVQREVQRAGSLRNTLKKLPASPSKDPGFALPKETSKWGHAFRRDKPGVTLHNLNTGTRPWASSAWAAQVASAANNSDATVAVTQLAYAMGGGPELVAAAYNSHAVLASQKKKIAFGKQLDQMLKVDVERFKAHLEADKTKANPIVLETLILKREKPALAKKGDNPQGKFVYDMDKVERLARMDETGQPRHMQDAISNARNVFLTWFIKDEVAGKRGARATYDVIRNIVNVGGSVALAVGTHGATTAAGIAAKQAGYVALGVGALDPAAWVRGYKQRRRDEKARQIEEGIMGRVYQYAQIHGLDPKIIEEARDVGSAFKVVLVSQLAGHFREVGISSTHPDPEINRLVNQTATGIGAAIEDNAIFHANKMTFGGIRIGKRTLFDAKGSHFNHKKSGRAKAERGILAAQHVKRIVDHRLEKFANNKQGMKELLPDTAEPADTKSYLVKQHRQRKVIKGNEDLRHVYDLFRNLGYGRAEVTSVIVEELLRHLPGMMEMPSATLPREVRDDIKAAGGAGVAPGKVLVDYFGNFRRR